MRRRPPRSTRTNTLFPYTTLFRSELVRVAEAEGGSEADLAQHLIDAAVRVVEPVDRQRLHEDAVDRMARVQRAIGVRSEERRGGNECVSPCRSRWSRYI